MSLQAPEKLQKLQRTLHAKAKESPDFRFYARYDKVYREDVPVHAYRCVRRNGGQPGVEGGGLSGYRVLRRVAVAGRTGASR